jgi:hypothetical protein
MNIGVIVLTGGNIRNNHLYLSEIMDLFPIDAVGGSNEEARAPRLLEIHCGIGEPIITDIAGDKKIFRRRAWVAEFLQVHHLTEGDKVIIEKTGPSRYHVYPGRSVT